MDTAVREVRGKPALQQPRWPDDGRVTKISEELTRRTPLVDPAEIRTLRGLLASVARGSARVVQAGDCAEDPLESTVGYVARKAGVLDLLAGAMKMVSHRPVVRIGRIAGQFAKPRSQPFETVAGRELPVFRGHMVNSAEPSPEGRVPDPDRLLQCYDAAAEILAHLRALRGAGTDGAVVEQPVWSSHEALLLDYELAMLREDDHGLWLTSTHLPWIGERTRALDGAHVELFTRIANPVACKVGPSMTADGITALCERLDPDRVPGRLTLIARMGADAVEDLLPPLVDAVRTAGHPVIWLTDPMHANTVTTPDGLKTRYVEAIEREVRGFLRAARAAGGVTGGVHLETTPEYVTECVRNETHASHVGEKYLSHCDPRLTASQAISVIASWHD
ncbi:3-deoxy-7-phosphoheptulonate synthase [Streptomyces sp. NPDC004539]|uniref:3-deoxy-7-phosphoheptulonate synthase n=1 Tax=Streptomyces sp. NPDC004539 TaxID=3154280 RepID=UPI0033A18F7E